MALPKGVIRLRSIWLGPRKGLRSQMPEGPSPPPLSSNFPRERSVGAAEVRRQNNSQPIALFMLGLLLIPIGGTAVAASGGGAPAGVGMEWYGSC
jgi:hypothetical protein